MKVYDPDVIHNVCVYMCMCVCVYVCMDAYSKTRWPNMVYFLSSKVVIMSLYRSSLPCCRFKSSLSI